MINLFKGNVREMSNDDLATQEYLLAGKRLRGQVGQQGQRRLEDIRAEQSARASR